MTRGHLCPSARLSHSSSSPLPPSCGRLQAGGIPQTTSLFANARRKQPRQFYGTSFNLECCSATCCCGNTRTVCTHFAVSFFLGVGGVAQHSMQLSHCHSLAAVSSTGAFDTFKKHFKHKMELLFLTFSRGRHKYSSKTFLELSRATY